MTDRTKIICPPIFDPGGINTIYVQDALTVDKGHIKCIVVQKESALTTIFSVDFLLRYMCRY